MRAEMKRQGISVTGAAETLGKKRQQVSRLLSDSAQRGEVTDDWQELLDLLGLEVVVQKKG